MEYLEGESLADRLRRGPLPPDELLKCVVGTCDGLAMVHRSGLIHRDLKPGSIMLTNIGAKWLDFGLAKRSRAVSRSQGKLVGTFSYFSPEQLGGERADACSNIFAFGAVVYEMATGVSPFPADDMKSFLLATLGRVPASPVALNPQIPAGLEEIICKSLEKEREKRYQSATEMLAGLRRVKAQFESLFPLPPTCHRFR